MAFAATDEMKSSPFEHVLIHGLVRDALGRKMSKSLGNGIDPLEVIDQYGADALRFMLLSGIAPGSDIRYTDERVEAARNFANKLWNASRFVIMNLKDEAGNFLPMASAETADLQSEDKWIISTINSALPDITANMESFDFALAAGKINDLIWDNYCDWYIELVKARLWSDDEEDKKTARYVLVSTLKDLLKLLHPFMPFITEEIWSYLPKAEDAKDFLMLESWPQVRELDYGYDVSVIETAMDCIKAIRNIRVEAEAAPSRKLNARFVCDALAEERVNDGLDHIIRLGNLTSAELLSAEEAKYFENEETITAALPGIQIFVPSDELIDFTAEQARLIREKDRLEKEVARGEGKLANEKFVAKAPAALIEEERTKLANYKDMLSKTLQRLDTVNAKLMK
jgi:valyl-tRNA synthetase